ncbi:sigma-70 family RNA polymerase sigma factor [Lignipirellula cremea]|uniref:RNA polymerase sigma factor n=1 Tax=Lignipirellula cremea TaxID=2528010 RepID=A0A518DXE0_9BACT|nr:sigma-70 family RNA polymerase sigma factor [Lignipirellula cremea]QDU96502.1 RNA polymerase sigma factor YlaC [Lignipirellula cremea]
MDDPNSAAPRTRLTPSAWVDRHGDTLFRYALSRLRDGESAEEVVQQTFLAALQHQSQFSGTGTEQAWLLGILKRKVIDFIRLRERTSSLTQQAEEDASDALFQADGHWKKEHHTLLSRPFDSLEREEFWQILQACLETLPVRQADVFVLREMEERATNEICKDLEISSSNLWVLLHRARLRLSFCMRNRWQSDTP